MSNELLLKTRSVIIAQTAQGSAVSVGSFSSGTQTIIDNSFDGGSENARGASYLDVFFDIAIAAASNYAYVDVYMESSIDGTTFSEPKFVVRSESISTSSASLISICRLPVIPLYLKLKWKPYSHTIDGVLKVVPVLTEFQA